MIAFLLLLIGAAVGFGVDRFKASLERRTFKRQLTEELTTNLRMLPFLRQHLAASLEMAQQGRSPNIRAVHFCFVCYDAHFSALLPTLSSAEQNSIQFIYEYLRICNEIADAYSQLVFAASNKEEYSRLLRLYSGALTSLIKLTGKPRITSGRILQARLNFFWRQMKSLNRASLNDKICFSCVALGCWIASFACRDGCLE